MSAKVLIVEDNLNLKDLYVEILEAEHLRVIVATDGKEALELIHEGDWDLLLLDIMLPKLDGMAVLKDLEKDPALQGKPILIISNIADEELIKQCKELGVKDYLIKSELYPDAVVERVLKYLNMSTSGEQSSEKSYNGEQNNQKRKSEDKDKSDNLDLGDAVDISDVIGQTDVQD